MHKKIISILLAACMAFSTFMSSGMSIFAAQDPSVNVAQGKTAVASSEEASTVVAGLATDGNTSARNSRWGSGFGAGPHWIYVDLGSTMDVKVVQIYWESGKANSYKIQTAPDGTTNLSDNASWTDVYTNSTHPSQLKDKITLDEVKQARYVRLYIDSISESDPLGVTVDWQTIAIYEMEVYGGEPARSLDEMMADITVTQPQAGDTKLTYTLPEDDGYTFTYNGTDYEQIIDTDGTIYQPIVDTTVKASFKAVKKSDPSIYKFKEVNVTVPGKYRTEAGDNPALNVLPELAEWKGNTGNFQATDASRVVIASEDLRDTATRMAQDYKDITGKEISIVSGEPQAGDFYFTLTTDKSKGLKEEGYILEVADYVSVTAEDTVGAYWATRSILQVLKQNSDLTIAKGIARDYPLYRVRGIILDVGRKTFSMDFLQQMAKAMAWYKMNDFQVHLNDNYITLERYSSTDTEMEAYSGFRLESDIKKGGNNGLNKADLTNKDLYYTKDEFRSFIKESRKIGVNVIPEIDTPAHSLALTKVRPDLRVGDVGRKNDHLNLYMDREEIIAAEDAEAKKNKRPRQEKTLNGEPLQGKYQDSLDFVQSIFDEYLTDENPVFDEETVVNIGADEYNESSIAYRRFVNDMLEYVKSKGRKPRVWGSFTQCAEGEDIDAEDVEINLWNFGYANMDKMYEEGFDLINCEDAYFYIVPNANYYYDFLNDTYAYSHPVNTSGGVTIPAGDAQMYGGAFAMWNDMIDLDQNGMSEYDIYTRFNRSAALFGSNAWGKQDRTVDEAKTLASTLGAAPSTNFDYNDIEKDENGIITNQTADENTLLPGANTEETNGNVSNALVLKGDESYVEVENMTTAGLGNSLRMSVKRTSASDKLQVLTESAYGQIVAVQNKTGKVGFTRETIEYSFDYTLPIGKWVELEFKNPMPGVAELYVNGELKDTLGVEDGPNANRGKWKATLMLPLQYVGSKTNAFIGQVATLKAGTSATYVSTANLNNLLDQAEMKYDLIQDKTALNDAVTLAKVEIAKFAPAQADVTAAEEALEAALTVVELPKADFTEFNLLKAKLDTMDLTQYTQASVDSINEAFAQVDLNETNQATLDAQCDMIQNAFNSMTLKDGDNLLYIDRSLYTATASTYQPGAEPQKAVDGDASTTWHSKWSENIPPHWLQISLPEAKMINGVYFLPRPTGTNGIPTKYDIQVSTDNVTFTSVKSGTTEANNAEREFKFNAVKAQYVRFVIVEAGNGDGSCGEIKLSEPLQPDPAGLAAIKEEALTLDQDAYNPRGFAKVIDAIDEINELPEGADRTTIELLKIKLSEAIRRLVLADEVDKIDLELALADADALVENAYTANSWKTLAPVVEASNTTFDNEAATQDEVDQAAKAVNDAIEALVPRGDASGLSELVEEYATLVEGEYTTVSWAAYKEKLDAANAVIEGIANKTAEEVATATTNLTTAKEALVSIKALQDKVNEVKDTDVVDMTESTKTAFNEALKAANDTLAKADATADEVAKAVADLDAAKEALVSTKALKDKVAEVKDTDLTGKTDESKAAFEAALKAANDILAKADATAEEIAKAVADLDAAVKGLVVKPAKVTGLKASKNTYSSVKLTWNKVEGATGYEITRSTKKDGTYGKSVVVEDVDTAIVNKLKTGQTYYFKVRAINGDVKGDDCKAVSQKPIMDKAVVLVSVDQKTYGTLQVTWKGVAGAQNYYLERRVAGSKTWKHLKTFPSKARTAESRSLNTGTKYEYRVRASRNKGDERSYSPYSNIKGNTPVMKTTTVTVTKKTATSAKVSWKTVSGASGYEVYRATSSAGKYSKIKTLKADEKSMTNSKLVKGKTYYYKVRAYRTISGKKVYNKFSKVVSYKVK